MNERLENMAVVRNYSDSYGQVFAVLANGMVVKTLSKKDIREMKKVN